MISDAETKPHVVAECVNGHTWLATKIEGGGLPQHNIDPERCPLCQSLADKLKDQPAENRWASKLGVIWVLLLGAAMFCLPLIDLLNFKDWPAKNRPAKDQAAKIVPLTDQPAKPKLTTWKTATLWRVTLYLRDDDTSWLLEHKPFVQSNGSAEFTAHGDSQQTVIHGNYLIEPVPGVIRTDPDGSRHPETRELVVPDPPEMPAEKPTRAELNRMDAAFIVWTLTCCAAVCASHQLGLI